jgi:hypothetical protein
MGRVEPPPVWQMPRRGIGRTACHLHGINLDLRSADTEALRRVGSLFESGRCPAPRATFTLDIESEVAPGHVRESCGRRLFRSGWITAREHTEGRILVTNQHGSFALVDIGSLHAELCLTTAAVLDARVLLNVLLKPVLILLFRACGAYSVHAASVLRGEQNLLFVGDQRVGKSTICTMAVQAGYATLNDDQHLLRKTHDGRVEALGLPGPFNLDPSIAAYVPQLGFLKDTRAYYDGPKRSFAIDSVYPGCVRQRCVLTHLVFSSVPSPSNNTSVHSLSKADALCRLIRNSQMVLLDVGAADAHLHVLRQLVQQCDCVQASLGHDVYHEPSRVLDLCAQEVM